MRTGSTASESLDAGARLRPLGYEFRIIAQHRHQFPPAQIDLPPAADRRHSWATTGTRFTTMPSATDFRFLSYGDSSVLMQNNRFAEIEKDACSKRPFL